MLMHLDASPHEWFAGLLMQDLVVALDERQRPHIVRRFFRQDGTLFTFADLESVVRNYGRFCELYTARVSHF